MAGMGMLYRLGMFGIWVLLLSLLPQWVLAAELVLCSPFPHAIIALSQQVPFSVTSWIRTLKRNELVGGIPDSKHLEGMAVDIVLDDEDDLMQLLALIDVRCLAFGVEKGYIHLEQHGP